MENYRCPNCNTEVEEGEKICPKCGTQLYKTMNTSTVINYWDLQKFYIMK